MPITQSLTVSEPSPGYPIHIGQDLLGCADIFRPYIADKQVFILSQPNIARYYLSKLRAACTGAGALEINSLLIAEGEGQKSLIAAEQIWSRCLELNLHRDAVFIALGGGVVGDLGGFCASCFYRGITFIQCPTSLMAQIDSAVGGKTGINLRGVKNAIGHFYQPKAVMVDSDVLATLPDREYRSGLAELVKYGLGCDGTFFTWLEKNVSLLLNKAPKALHDAIYRACTLKSAVVQHDSYDQNERLRLNLGHTIGHALESLAGFEALRHGEAVSIGLIVAAQLTVSRGHLTEAELMRLMQLLASMGLPTHSPKEIAVEALCRHIRFDKKHLTHQMRWVLLKGIGQSYIAHDVTEDEVMTALQNVAVKRSSVIGVEQDS